MIYNIIHNDSACETLRFIISYGITPVIHNILYALQKNRIDIADILLANTVECENILIEVIKTKNINNVKYILQKFGGSSNNFYQQNINYIKLEFHIVYL